MQMFAVMYTLGNVIAMCGTGFLIGPSRQCKNMWKPVRAAASAVFLGMLICTLVVANVVEPPGVVPLVIVCIAIQFCAGVWYSASYIPYARKMIRECCKSTFCGSS